jgi:SAM-dependent methyltransferase
VSVATALASRWGRQRQTGSLCLRSGVVLKALVARTQSTRFGPFVTPQTFELARSDEESLASAQREFDDGAGFFGHFGGELRETDFAGRTILDLGCGYGGRTVYYAERCRAKFVVGVEILEPMVDRCRRFAQARDVGHVEFQTAAAEALEFADATFDCVVSYDVFEHVDDPLVAMREAARLTRPGGDIWLVLPTYLGARASHLDYLTQLPMLHRIFDPATIVDVVNEFLIADPELYGVPPQPAAGVGALGHRTLPSVNGATRREIAAIIDWAGLETVSARTQPIMTENAPLPFARQATRALEAWESAAGLPELLIGHMTYHLRKPPAAA